MTIALADLVFRFPEHPQMSKRKLNDLITHVETISAVTTDPSVAALASTTGAADKVPYFTSASAMALADFTAAGRALLDDANAAAQRTTLGLGTGDSPSFTDLTISGLFRLSGAGDVTLASIDHPFQIGADNGFNLAIDRNELQTRNNGASSEMHLNQSGGTVYIGHDHASDASIASTVHHLQVGPTTGLNLRFDGNEILAVNDGATSTLFLNNDGGSPVSIGTGGLTVQGGTLTLNSNVAISFAGTGAATTRTNLGLGNSGVTPASYTNANITVDVLGRVTAASNGASGGGLSEVTLTADYVNATNVFTNITDGTRTLQVAIPANTNFEIEGVILIQTSTNTNLPRIGVAIPAMGAGSFGAVQIDQTGATVTSRVSQDGTFTTIAANVQVPAGGVAAANTPYLSYVTIRGRAGATGGTISLQMACETAAAATCRVLAGSQLRYKLT